MEDTCAFRLLQPFMVFASTRHELRDLAPPALTKLHLDSRLPLRACHDGLIAAAERLRRPTLGLEMGQGLRFGSGGVFDFAVRSSATVRESLQVAARFSNLIASPFLVSLESRERMSVIRVDDEKPWTTVTGDFALSAWYRTHAAEELPPDAHPECWFPYARPSDDGEYERAFPGAVVRFDAPFLGFVFDRRFEDAPMPVGDPLVHAMVCARAEVLLRELENQRPTTFMLRRLINQDVRDGHTPTLESVARRLHLSPRTVGRKLEQEGTSFASEVDDARRELALTLVRQSELPFSDIASKIGFSHSESFYRAFRRWTGATPQVCRTAAVRDG